MQLNTRVLETHFKHWNKDTGARAGDPALAALWSKTGNDQTKFAKDAAARWKREELPIPWVEALGTLLDGLLLHEVCDDSFFSANT